MTQTITAPPLESRPLDWLWNPFRRIAGWPALGIGLAIILLTSLLGSFTNTHFDGVLDTHTGRAAPLWVFLSQGVINWLSLSVVLWLGSFILTSPRSYRWIDLFGTQALARWPFLLSALVCFIPGYASLTEKMIRMVESMKFTLPEVSAMEIAAFTIATTVMLIATVWFVALAWKSFRLSCDVKGGKAVVTFIVAIIVAEVISKVLIIVLLF